MRKQRIGSPLFVVALMVTIVIIAVGASEAVAPDAGATGFHQYATAYIDSSTVYTGLEQARYDHTMSITSGATCGVPYAAAANPVYQTQWVLITGHPSGNHSPVLSGTSTTRGNVARIVGNSDARSLP